MTWSTCPKCGSHAFEYVENQPEGSIYNLYFVQCSACGAVVGTMDLQGIGNQNQQIREELQVLTKKVEQNKYVIDQIANLLNQMINK
jgi:predicted  nucleic acid-binding Zn-ribbon protein